MSKGFMFVEMYLVELVRVIEFVLRKLKFLFEEVEDFVGEVWIYVLRR